MRRFRRAPFVLSFLGVAACGSSHGAPSATLDAGVSTEGGPIGPIRGDAAVTPDAATSPPFDAAGAAAATPFDATSPFEGVAGGIVFSPAAYVLASPAAGATAPPETMTFTLTVRGADGGIITPTPDEPVMLNVYGPSVIEPTTMQVTSSAPVAFSYSGGYFNAPMTITATLQTDAGVSLGTATLLPTAANECTRGTVSASLPLHCATMPCTAAEVIEKGLNVEASIGGAAKSEFELDTGSLELVVPASEIGPNAIGPGPSGMKFYNSDGYEFLGNYYLTTVTFYDSAGASHTTIPMLVLGTTSTACHSGYPSCTPPANSIHLIGIGFDRNSSTAGDLASGPTFNPFLQLSEEVVSQTMSPGYVLTGGSGALGLTARVGVTNEVGAGETVTALTPSTTVPGDFSALPGCFAFPELDAGPFCGKMLVDVGYGGSFLELPTSERPAAIASANPPSGTVVRVLGPSALNDSLLDYSFTYLGTNLSTAAPDSLAWSGTTATFINTGRHLLADYDYFVDMTCGVVGFAASDAGGP